MKNQQKVKEKILDNKKIKIIKLLKNKNKSKFK